MNYEEFKSAFSYNPDTGIFTRLVHTNNRSKGREDTGYKNNQHGYIMLQHNGMRIYAHRLAFLFMTGEIPTSFIDHIDGNPSNNKWSNLRLATAKQNTYNRKTPKTNSSGIKGVCWNKKANKWQAGIKYNGVSIHLGLFTELEQAAIAVRDKRRELHGNFSRDS